jgi:pimeloyl-ACP methyl ester carboxylesterase
VAERDLDLGGGRTLHMYDSGSGELPVFWHHGTPNIGAPPVPRLDAARKHGVRWLSYDRRGYGGSTPQPGRTVGSASALTAAVADADEAAFDTAWGWLLDVVRPAVAAGTGGLVDDDLAYVLPWGCDPTTIPRQVLLMHGAADRMVPSSHGEWLAAHLPSARLRLYPDDGHISVLLHAETALAWLAA